MLLIVPPRRGFSGWTVPPPDIAPASSSVRTASANPLCAPNGSSAPRGSWNITSGSLVGAPPASIRLPSGSFLPARFATATLPIATPLVAMSSRSGGRVAVPGMPMQTGFVEKRASLPR